MSQYCSSAKLFSCFSTAPLQSYFHVSLLLLCKVIFMFHYCSSAKLFTCFSTAPLQSYFLHVSVHFTYLVGKQFKIPGNPLEFPYWLFPNFRFYQFANRSTIVPLACKSYHTFSKFIAGKYVGPKPSQPLPSITLKKAS